MIVHTETGYRTGDWVVVCRPGPRFGCSGIINRVAQSDDTDLWRYRIGGEWYYADELMAQPGGAPEWQLPAGPARDIVALASRCGWAVHTDETDNSRVIAAISPTGAVRIHAVWVLPLVWSWAVETIDPRKIASRSGLGPRQHGTQQELEQLFAAHTDTDAR